MTRCFIFKLKVKWTCLKKFKSIRWVWRELTDKQTDRTKPYVNPLNCVTISTSPLISKNNDVTLTTLFPFARLGDDNCLATWSTYTKKRERLCFFKKPTEKVNTPSFVSIIVWAKDYYVGFTLLFSFSTWISYNNCLTLTLTPMTPTIAWSTTRG